MAIPDTIRRGDLPLVSAHASMVLAALGLLSILLGLVAGTLLLIPAGLSGILGFLAGLRRTFLVSRGLAWPREGATALAAATFVNGSLALFVALAGFIVLRFGA
jgi:hypothetical protein